MYLTPTPNGIAPCTLLYSADLLSGPPDIPNKPSPPNRYGVKRRICLESRQLRKWYSITVEASIINRLKDAFRCEAKTSMGLLSLAPILPAVMAARKLVTLLRFER